MKHKFLSLLIATTITIGLFTLLEYQAILNFDKSLSDIKHIQSLRTQVIYNDEVLTNSATMMALTGDTAWIDRYNKAEIILSKTLDKIYLFLPKEVAKKTVQVTDKANDLLVNLEKKSFVLAKQNKNQEAFELLNSKEYKDNKKFYTKGMNNLIDEVYIIEKDLISNKQYKAARIGLFKMLLFSTIVFLWILFYRDEKMKGIHEIQNIRNILHTTLDNLPALVWTKNKNGSYLFVNKNFSKHTKFTAEQLIGKTDYTWVPQHLADAFRNDDQWVIENHKNIEREEMVPNIEGKEVIHYTVKFPIHDSKQNIIGTGGFSFDISEIKEKEKELDYHKKNLEKLVESQTKDLKEAMNKLDRIMENSPGMVYQFILDKDNKMYFPYVSAQAFEIFEISPHEFSKDPAIMLKMAQKNDGDRLNEKILESAQKMQRFEWTGEITTKQGKRKWLKASSVPRYDDDNNILWDGLVIDITKEKLIAQQLEKQTDSLIKAKEQAESANKAKSIFLANMSHEIRTPMHGVLSFAEIGLDKVEVATKEELKDYFTEIHETGKRLMSLLNDLLDLSKLEANKTNYTFSKHDLSHIIKASLSQFSQFAAEKAISFNFEENFNDSIIELDEQKIHQVMANIISNAVKFAFNNTTITLTLKEVDSEFLIQIENEGIEIPKEELNIIFDNFAQSSKTRSNAGGTGLGLSISKRIINGHSGKIWAESHHTKVSFYILLPKVQTQQKVA